MQHKVALLLGASCSVAAVEVSCTQYLPAYDMLTTRLWSELMQRTSIYELLEDDDQVKLDDRSCSATGDERLLGSARCPGQMADEPNSAVLTKEARGWIDTWFGQSSAAVEIVSVENVYSKSAWYAQVNGQLVLPHAVESLAVNWVLAVDNILPMDFFEEFYLKNIFCHAKRGVVTTVENAARILRIPTHE